MRKIATVVVMMVIGLTCFAESKVKQEGIGSDGYYFFYVEADTYEELDPYIDKFDLRLYDVIPHKARYWTLPEGVKERRDYWTFELVKKPEEATYNAQAEVVHNTINVIVKDGYKEKYSLKYVYGGVIKEVTRG